MLIEQEAHMMVEFTQLRAGSKHHTAEFAILRGAISYVWWGIWQMCEHWDYDGDDESNEANDGDDIVAD